MLLKLTTHELQLCAPTSNRDVDICTASKFWPKNRAHYSRRFQLPTSRSRRRRPWNRTNVFECGLVFECVRMPCNMQMFRGDVCTVDRRNYYANAGKRFAATHKDLLALLETYHSSSHKEYKSLEDKQSIYRAVITIGRVSCATAIQWLIVLEIGRENCTENRWKVWFDNSDRLLLVKRNYSYSSLCDFCSFRTAHPSHLNYAATQQHQHQNVLRASFNIIRRAFGFERFTLSAQVGGFSCNAINSFLVRLCWLAGCGGCVVVVSSTTIEGLFSRMTFMALFIQCAQHIIGVGMRNECVFITACDYSYLVVTI